MGCLYMEKVTVSKITGHEYYGIDYEGVEVLLTKTSRVSNLKVGDTVQGNFQNDDDSPDEFYFEIHSIAYNTQGLIKKIEELWRTI